MACCAWGSICNGASPVSSMPAIAGFFAVGAYATAILTSPESPHYLGGFGWPPLLALPIAMLLLGPHHLADRADLPWPRGRLSRHGDDRHLRDHPAGSEELKTGWPMARWGSRPCRAPFESLGQPWGNIAFLGFVLVLVVVLYIAAERAWASPWGVAVRAIRDNELAAAAIGKDVVRFA